MWQGADDVWARYSNWRKVGKYAQAEIDVIIWWFRVIVQLLFVLIDKGKDK